MAPREKVIGYFSKPELYLKVHSKYYKSFKILENEKNMVLVDEEWEFGNRRLSFIHKITLNLPNRIDLEIIIGDGKGSRETIMFEETSTGTKVTYISDFKFHGLTNKFFGWLASKQIKKMLEEMAEGDRRYLEGK